MRQPRRLERVFDLATAATARILALAFILAVCLNFANVIGRYFFGKVMLSADEVQSFILIVMTVLGAAVVTWRGSHITMSVVVDLMPQRIGKAIAIAAHLTLTVIAVLIAWQSWKITAAMFDMGRVSDAAGLPMWIIHGLVLVALILIAVFALCRALGGSHQDSPP
jgi:TRAP-type C4-dicarboxylate transport system permease small subunit